AVRPLRAGARLGAGHRRTRRREPAGRDPVARHDAARELRHGSEGTCRRGRRAPGAGARLPHRRHPPGGDASRRHRGDGRRGGDGVARGGLTEATKIPRAEEMSMRTILALALSSALAFAGARPAAAQEKPEKASLHIAAASVGVTYLPVILAKQRGYFRDE